MNEEQLKWAKAIAKSLLYLPLKRVESEPDFYLTQHPYFCTVFMSDNYGVFNALEEPTKYKEYLKKVEKIQIEEQESIDNLLVYIRKPFKLLFIQYLEDLNVIGHQEASNLAARVYFEVENPLGNVNITVLRILGWLRDADKSIYYDNEENELLYASLPEEVIIYRGVRDKAYVKGISWTTDKDMAIWYADRFTGKGYLYQAKVSKEDIIAYTNDRKEKEVIVDFAKIRDVEEIKRA